MVCKKRCDGGLSNTTLEKNTNAAENQSFKFKEKEMVDKACPGSILDL